MMTPWLGPYKTSLKVLYTLAGALPYKACPWYMLSKIWQASIWSSWIH
jgi:hypothetical protein